MTDTTDSGPAARAPRLREEILAFYNRGAEDRRLRAGRGRLELLRTQDVLRRVLPSAPADVLDVGGGSGVHAAWLAADGYRVALIDPVPLHVRQAGGLPGVRARIGDARALGEPPGSTDVVLMLGPLYHLPQRDERILALRQAVRVLRPGGLLVAATINRYAALHDTLTSGVYFDPARRVRIDRTSDDGHNRGPHPEQGFTTAYFHRPEEVPVELAEAGLATDRQYGVQGAAWLMADLNDWLDDPRRLPCVLDAVRMTESEPSLLGVSAHVLTVAHKAPA